MQAPLFNHINYANEACVFFGFFIASRNSSCIFNREIHTRTWNLKIFEILKIFENFKNRLPEARMHGVQDPKVTFSSFSSLSSPSLHHLLQRFSQSLLKHEPFKEIHHLIFFKKKKKNFSLIIIITTHFSQVPLAQSKHS